MAIPFVHVQARGSYRELGRAVGEAAREQVRASVDFFRDDFASMTGGRLTFEEAERQRRPTPSRRAAGCRATWRNSRASPRALACRSRALPVLNCGEEFTSENALPRAAAGSPRSRRPLHGRRRRRRGRHIVGHNMDWYVIDAVNNVLFDLTGPDGTRIMGLAGAPYLLDAGHEQPRHRQRQQLGALHRHPHRRPQRVRAPVDAGGADAGGGAAGGCSPPAPAAPTSSSPTPAAGSDLETSATAHALMHHTAAGFMAHSNHYVSPAMQPYEGYGGGESTVRLSTAERLLAEGIAAGEDPVDLVARVLRTPRAVAGGVHLWPPGARRGAGGPGHDRGQHHPRPRRAPVYACAGFPVREPVSGLREE